METAVVVGIPEIAAEFPPGIIALPGPRVVRGCGPVECRQ